MKLVISKEYPYSFAMWITKRLKFEIMSRIESRKFELFEEYVFNTLDIRVSAYQIAIKYLDEIRISITKDSYVIQPNENIKYKNSNVRLSSLINLLDFGTLNLKGYSVFNQTFNRMQKELPIYFEMYSPCSRRFIV